jgi:hypothetical protein
MKRDFGQKRVTLLTANMALQYQTACGVFEQLRQLCDIGSDAPGLITCEQVRRRSFLEVDAVERLSRPYQALAAWERISDD